MTRLLPWLLLILILLPLQAGAQTNACDPATPPVTVPLNPGVTSIVWIQTDHTAVDANKQPVIVSYLGEILTGTTVVTNWTIPKTDLVPLTGTPANCYRVPLPGFKGLLPTAFYQIRVNATGQPGTPAGVSSVSTDRFFLLGVPSVPGTPRILP